MYSVILWLPLILLVVVGNLLLSRHDARKRAHLDKWVAEALEEARLERISRGEAE